MSASNWAICPKCLAAAKAEQAQKLHDSTAAYGKVSPEEWILLNVLALTDPDPEKYRTFREDYEIFGVMSGTLKISYGGSCDVCGLSATLQHQQQVWPPAS